jgi:hypothetical protein
MCVCVCVCMYVWWRVAYILRALLTIVAVGWGRMGLVSCAFLLVKMMHLCVLAADGSGGGGGGGGGGVVMVMFVYWDGCCIGRVCCW